MQHPCRSAFTLVELSLSLVIIGLLAGGVLSAQDLIRASTIRSAASDIEKYNTAATAFKSKYGGIPGDISANRAIEFNFSAAGDTNATGAAGLRDGNGVVEGGGAGSTRLVGETGLFWQDLTAAAFIGGSYTATGTTTTTGTNVPQGDITRYLPRTRLRENVSHFLYADAGANYYYLAAFSTDASANVIPANAVKPIEAKGIDEKLDDGFPTSGSVISMANLTTVDAGAAAGPTICTVNTTPSVYNVSSAATGAVETQVCQLRIRSAF